LKPEAFIGQHLFREYKTMKLIKVLIFTVLISLVSIVFAQHSKYTVADYFLFIPIQYMNETFVANSTGESAAMRDGIFKDSFVDIKNGYISQSHPVDPDLINEFVVWKSKNQSDVIAISGRLDFSRYNGNDSSSLDSVTGLSQYLRFYQFSRGEWLEHNKFLPSKSNLFAKAIKKYPAFLNYKTNWRFAFIPPRIGTTARIVLYFKIKNSSLPKLIVKDLYKIIWNGTDFSVIELGGSKT
jgi:hypothetical protein